MVPPTVPPETPLPYVAPSAAPSAALETLAPGMPYTRAPGCQVCPGGSMCATAPQDVCVDGTYDYRTSFANSLERCYGVKSWTPGTCGTATPPADQTTTPPFPYTLKPGVCAVTLRRPFPICVDGTWDFPDDQQTHCYGITNYTWGKCGAPLPEKPSRPANQPPFPYTRKPGPCATTKRAPSPICVDGTWDFHDSQAAHCYGITNYTMGTCPATPRPATVRPLTAPPRAALPAPATATAAVPEVWYPTPFSDDAEPPAAPAAPARLLTSVADAALSTPFSDSVAANDPGFLQQCVSTPRPKKMMPKGGWSMERKQREQRWKQECVGKDIRKCMDDKKAARAKRSADGKELHAKCAETVKQLCAHTPACQGNCTWQCLGVSAPPRAPPPLGWPPAVGTRQSGKFCSRPFVQTGKCNAAKPYDAWSWDPATKQCVKFAYDGCIKGDADGNVFFREDECVASAKKWCT